MAALRRAVVNAVRFWPHAALPWRLKTSSVNAPPVTCNPP